MKNFHQHVVSGSKKVASHVQKHHKKYLGGFFAGFAVVKTLKVMAVMAGFLVGLANVNNTSAQEIQNIHDCEFGDLSWNNENFLDETFWSEWDNLSSAEDKSGAIICALYGSGEGDTTAYTLRWNNWNYSKCSGMDMNVEEIEDLPIQLFENTIYVLNTGKIIKGTIYVSNCSAVISKSETTLYTNDEIGYEFYLSNVQYGIFDNLYIDGENDGNNGTHPKNDGGIYLQRSSNNTIHGLKSYNGKGNGLYLESSNNNIIEDVRTYNNGNGILIKAAESNILDNIQIFSNNSDGIRLGEYSKYNKIDNIQIYNNNGHGIHLYNTTVMSPNRNQYNNFNNIQIFSNGGRGIYGERGNQYSTFNNIQIYNNNSDGFSIAGIQSAYNNDSNVLNNVQVYNNNGYGINIGNYNSNFILHNVSIYNNARNGLLNSRTGTSTTFYGDLYIFDNESDGKPSNVTQGYSYNNIGWNHASNIIGENVSFDFMSNPIDIYGNYLLSWSGDYQSLIGRKSIGKVVGYSFGSGIMTQDQPVLYNGTTLTTGGNYDITKYIGSDIEKVEGYLETGDISDNLYITVTGNSTNLLLSHYSIFGNIVENIIGENLGDSTGITLSDGYGIKKIITQLYGDDYHATHFQKNEEIIQYFEVKFDGNRGTSTESQTIASGSTVERPSEDPELPGYEFSGWYLSGENVSFDFEHTSITGDITLYAKWNYTGIISDLDVYFLLSDGTTGHTTLMDRNLGATTTGAGSNASSNSYGFYYQWGNNYGFPTIGTVSTMDTQVSNTILTQYVPSKYASGLFVSGYNSWMTGLQNIWGGLGDEIERQGPCPDGYHVPLNEEWHNVYNYWNNSKSMISNSGEQWSLDFFMPFAGSRTTSSELSSTQGDIGNYWSASADGINNAYILLFYKNADLRENLEGSYSSAIGISVRCFKNFPTPSLNIHSNGGTGALVIVHSGVITTLGSPTKGNTEFLGWYSTSDFSEGTEVSTGSPVSSNLYAKWRVTNTVTFDSNGGTSVPPIIVTSGETINQPSNPEFPGYEFSGWYLSGEDTTFDFEHTPITGDITLYAKWNYTGEIIDLNVYFISSTGALNSGVIMDRNLGASEIYNQNYDDPNIESYGYYYQWGNNYGFPNTGNIVTGSIQVNTNGYGPGNYYISGVFIKMNSDWSSETNDDLRGGDTNTLEARQGPCPDGYHIPNNIEWMNLLNNKEDALGIIDNTGIQRSSDLFIPFAGYRDTLSDVDSHGVEGNYWSTYSDESDTVYVLHSDSDGIYSQNLDRANGFSLRCFKNTGNEILSIEPNGGTGAMIAFTGTINTGIFTKLGIPTKANAIFSGWYSTSNFSGGTEKTVGDPVSAELYAKWECKNGYYEKDGECIQIVCLSGWENDKFLDKDFWSGWNNLSTKEKNDAIICALYGSGEGDTTAYTKYRSGWSRGNRCDVIHMNVEYTNTLPGTLSGNTIYVVDSNSISKSTTVMGDCSAVVSSRVGSTTFNGTSTKNTQGMFYFSGNSYSILDNLNMVGGSKSDDYGVRISGGGRNTLNNIHISNYSGSYGGLFIQNVSEYNLINHTIVQNSNNGIYLTGKYNILNNVQSFNNKNYGLYISINGILPNTTNTPDSYTYNSVNNSQFYKNGGAGIYIKSRKNILNNVQSYSNNGTYGLYINNSDNKLHDVDIYNNSRFGLYITTYTGYLYGNIRSFANNSGDTYGKLEYGTDQSTLWGLDTTLTTGISMSWDYITNPIDTQGKYLLTWTGLLTNNRGINSSFGYVNRYSFGSGIKTQQQPVYRKLNKYTIDITPMTDNYYDSDNYIGSYVNKLTGELQIPDEIEGTTNITVTGISNANTKYSIFGNISGTIIGKTPGTSVSIDLAVPAGDAILVTQLSGANIFATHFERVIPLHPYCHPEWDNDNFLTGRFWTLNPTNEQIICALYGDGEGDTTAYTSGWNNWNYSQCSGMDINVVETSILPTTLDENTIYVLNTGKITSEDIINMSKCSAIVSKSGTELFLQYNYQETISFYNDQYGILDNIKINGEGDAGSLHDKNNYGVYFQNSSGNTLNNIENYNNEDAGIYIGSSSDYNILNNIQSRNNNYGIYFNYSHYNILNNIQSKDNNYGIYFTSSSRWNKLNNIEIRNNDNGIFLSGGSYNILNNIQSKNNNYGIYLQNTTGNTLNNIQSYNNNSTGIILQGAQNNTLQNVQTYNNTVGIQIYASSHSNILHNIQSYNNNNYGIRIDSSQINTLNNIQTYNNGYGIYISTAIKTILNNVQSYNNTGCGIGLFNDYININNIYIYNNGCGIAENSKVQKFFGVLYVSSNDTNNSRPSSRTAGQSDESPVGWNNGSPRSLNISFDYMTNPKDSSGNYLLDWGTSSWSSLRGKKSIGEVIGYSYGSGIKTQEQPVARNGNTLTTRGNYDSSNYIGSDVRKVAGSITTIGSIKNGGNVNVIGNTISEGISNYSIFGNLSRNMIGELIGNSTGIILSGNEGGNLKIVTQLYGDGLFATHFENTVNYELNIVTFDSDRGTKVAPQYISSGEKAIQADAISEFPGYELVGWYTDENLTTQFDFDTAITSNITLYAKWIYTGRKVDLDIYFIKGDGTTGHTTLMDSNMGATEAYTGLNNTDTYGFYYQWGNNYGFNGDDISTIRTSTNRVNTAGYGPGNYYISGTFITKPYAEGWESDNRNLWGGNGSVIDRQGPCPDGYHIPTNAEFVDIYNSWLGSTNYSTNICTQWSLDFLTPFPGNRTSQGQMNSVGNIGVYWSTTTYDGGLNNQSYAFTFDSYYNSVSPQVKLYRPNGLSLRCFKNIENEILSIEPNGGTGALIIVHSGVITELGIPSKANSIFSGWYSDSSFGNKVEIGNNVQDNNIGTLYAKWECQEGYVENELGDACVTAYTVTFNTDRGTKVEPQKVTSGAIITDPNTELPGYSHTWYLDSEFTNEFDLSTAITGDITLYAKWNYDLDFADLDVYFLTSTGDLLYKTLMDRNLGAVTTYNQKYNNPNENSYGYYYQWGNNYGFPREGNVTTGGTQVQHDIWTQYIPSKYASGVFIVGQTWMSGGSNTDNIWGGESENIVDRQGPCPDEYYIPTTNERLSMYNNRYGLVNYTNISVSRASDFLMPFAGNRDSTLSRPMNRGLGAYYRSSTASDNNRAYKFAFSSASPSFLLWPQYSDARGNGYSIRCFKNNVLPNMTIHPNGGTGALIIVHSGTIKKLGEPSRENSIFSGWYADSEYSTPKINESDLAPNDLYAKRECEDGYIENALGNACIDRVEITITTGTYTGYECEVITGVASISSNSPGIFAYQWTGGVFITGLTIYVTGGLYQHPGTINMIVTGQDMSYTDNIITGVVTYIWYNTGIILGTTGIDLGVLTGNYTSDSGLIEIFNPDEGACDTTYITYTTGGCYRSSEGAVLNFTGVTIELSELGNNKTGYTINIEEGIIGTGYCEIIFTGTEEEDIAIGKINFVVDTKLPTANGDGLGLIGGLGDMCTSGNIFTVTGTFNEEVMGVVLTGEKVTGLTMVSGGPGSGTYVWTGKLTGGTGKVWLITANIRDLNGNTLSGTIDELVVGNYDNAGPNQVTLTQPGNTVYKSSTTLKWLDTEDEGCVGVSGYNWEIYSGACEGGTRIDSGFILSGDDLSAAINGLIDDINYCRRVQPVDNYGNEGAWRSDSFEVDLSDVRCNITPINESCTSGSVEVQLTGHASTDQTLYLSWISTGDHNHTNTLTTGLIYSGQTITGYVYQTGTEKWKECSYTAENIIDKENPTVELPESISIPECTTGTVTATGNDEGCGSSPLTYSWSGFDFTTNTISLSLYSGNVGSRTVSVQVQDTVGNTTGSSVIFTWTNSGITAENFTGNDNVGNSPKTVNWRTESKATDGLCGNGENNVMFSRFISTGTKGECTVNRDIITYTPKLNMTGEDSCEIELVDDEGSGVQVEIKWKGIDTVKPICSIAVAEGCFSGGVELTVTSSETIKTIGGGIDWNKFGANATGTVYVNGNISVVVEDEAGNTGSCSTGVDSIRTGVLSAPSELSPANGIPTNDNTPTFTWNTSAGDGCRTVSGYQVFILSGNDVIDSGIVDSGTNSWIPTAELDDGPYSWYVQVQDILGGTNDSPSNELTINTSEMTCYIMADIQSCTSGGIEITLTGNGLYYSWTGIGETGTKLTKTITSNGTYVGYVWDEAGNTGSCSTGINNYDNSTPNITSMNTLEFTGYECDTITGYVQANDNGGDSCGSLTYNWDGVDGTSTYTLTQNWTGIQTISVNVRDSAGNSTGVDITYQWFDRELRLGDTGHDLSLITGTVEISDVTASDVFNATGYGSCEILTGALISCRNATGELVNNSLSITPNPNIEGTGLCTITFTDGDTTKTGTVTFRIDTKGPTTAGDGLGLTGGYGVAQCTNEKEFTVTGIFNEAVVGVVLTGRNVKITGNNPSGQTGYVWTVTLLGGTGEVEITGDITDIYGNKLSGTIDKLIIGNYDNVGPNKVTLRSPTPGIIPTTNATLTWNASTDRGCANEVSYKFTMTGDHFSTGQTLSGTSIDISGLENGHTYYRNVVAVDKYGNQAQVSDTWFVEVNTDGIPCTITADRNNCGPGEVSLTLTGGNWSGVWVSWTGFENMITGNKITRSISTIGNITGYVQNHRGQTGFCVFQSDSVWSLIDSSTPRVSATMLVTGYECQTIVGSVSVQTGDSCGKDSLDKFTYNWKNGGGTASTFALYSSEITGYDVELIVKDGAGNTTGLKVRYEWLNSPVTASGFTWDLVHVDTVNWKQLSNATDGACGSGGLTATFTCAQGGGIIQGDNLKYMAADSFTGSDTCTLTIKDNDGGTGVSVTVKIKHAYVELLTPDDKKEIESGSVTFRWIAKNAENERIAGYQYQIGSNTGFVKTTGVTLNLNPGTYNWSVSIVNDDKQVGGISEYRSLKVVASTNLGEKDYCPNGDLSDSYYDGTCDVHGASECLAGASQYSTELQEAYQYAYGKGVTTQCPIYSANMDGYLYRDHFAKMISVYAMNVAGKTPNYGKYGCDRFSDTSSDYPELQRYMTLACQLELMGMNSDGVTPKTYFDPYSILTRAEFGTVFSRLIFGDTYNVKNEASVYNQEGFWYKRHLEALRDYGVMTKIDGDWPKYLERRGRVMLMMKRADVIFKGQTAAVNGIKALVSSIDNGSM